VARKQHSLREVNEGVKRLRKRRLYTMYAIAGKGRGDFVRTKFLQRWNRGLKIGCECTMNSPKFGRELYHLQQESPE